MASPRRFFGILVCGSLVLSAQWYAPPAGIRPPARGKNAALLPGGKIAAPLGEQLPVGSGPFTLALSPSGKTLLTANLGPDPPSLTVLNAPRRRDTTRGADPAGPDSKWDIHHFPIPNAAPDAPNETTWHGVSTGAAFAGEHNAYVSEGASGRVGFFDLETGDRRRTIDLNQGGFQGSFTGSLAYDARRNLVYIADLGNARVAAVDARSRQPAGSAATGRLPSSLALAPGSGKLYAASWEMNSIYVIDTADPTALKVEAVIPRTPSPSGILATADRVFVSNSRDDSITVIDPRTNEVTADIPIRIPGLAAFRGVLPAGLAFDEQSGWLLVAEGGINAVGVIDTKSAAVLGHIPVGWFPARLLVENGMVYVANSQGSGSGPSAFVTSDGKHASRAMPPEGSVSAFPLPSASALAAQTEVVMRANGFQPLPPPARVPPAGIRHVVLIVNGTYPFDEILGDLTIQGKQPVAAAPILAHYGRFGYADGRREVLSLKSVNITPNHHEIAGRWALSDNFYTDSQSGDAGHRWLAGLGLLPGASAARLPDAEAVREHLAQHGVSVLDLGGLQGGDRETSATERTAGVIREIEQRFVRGGSPLPQFLSIRLPYRHAAPGGQEKGYPYAESYVTDGDNALGRLLEYLSGTPWWSQMAVFITGPLIEEGTDHVDAHRIPLLCAGPWVKRGYVSHGNTSFPGLWKTVFAIFHVPALNLFDATAADLTDMFRAMPDPAPYHAAAIDKRIFNPDL